MKLIDKTIGECLQERIKMTPDKTALEADGQSYTWAGLDLLSDYMAVRMNNCGVKKETHAGIWSTNSPNWVIVFLALVKLGAVPVLLNTCYSKEELERVLWYSDVEFVYYGEGYKKLVYATTVEELESVMDSQIRRWIYIGRDTGRRWMSEESFVRSERMKKAVGEIPALTKKTVPEDTAAILFTSGTTSSPKGVMLSHYNLVNSSLETCEHMRWGQEDKMLIAVPLFHCFGITSSLLASIHVGFSMYVIEYYKTLTVLGTIQNQRCTILNGVPSMFLAVVNNPAHKKYDLSSLKRGIIAGSPYTPEEYMQIRREIPNLILHASYGQTETSPCVSIGDVGDSDQENACTAGRVLEHCQVGIFDLDSGRQMAAGETGEIRVRGYNVMQGYYKLPEETGRTIGPDGWLRTGDLGYLDERRFLHFTGRIKEMIIRGGENIFPGEIEAFIREYPGVSAVKVIGLPTQVLQEMVVACIIMKEGRTISETGLRSYLEHHLAYYKIPSWIVLFDRFPISASGKIQLAELKRLAMMQLSGN